MVHMAANMQNEKQSKLTTKEICVTGVLTAVIVIMSQISIPMPSGVPMTMQTFAITLAAVVLGAKLGGFSALIYILLGAVGLPVFAGFTGGFSYFVDPTGGFIISFPIMAYIIGLGIDLNHRFKGAFIICLILGTIVNYVFGTFFFCFLTNSSIMAGIAACVLPFIPTAILKAILATILGIAIRRRLSQI